jgi:hypothetical protein
MTIPTPGIDQAEEWSGVSILPPGEHTVTITEVEEGTSGGGHPALKLQFVAPSGDEIRDTCTVIESTYGKVKQLYAACGLPAPSQGVSGSDVKGKKINVRVALEPRNDDPSKMVSRVKAYKPPMSVDGTPAVASQTTNGVSGGQPAFDDIPF